MGRILSMRAFLILHFFLICVTSMVSQPGELKTEIDKIIAFDTEIDFKRTPGFIISVIDGDSVSFFSYGTREKQKNILPEKTDVFEIGSVTQILTAMLIKRMIEAGSIAWTDKINRFVPEEYRNPRLDTLTIYHLVNHKTVLPERPPVIDKIQADFKCPYQYYSSENLLAFYRDFINTSQKNGFSYINYGLLEIILTRATNKSFEDLIKEYIATPLSLKHIFTDFGEQRNSILIPGYTFSSTLSEPWQFASFRASEGLKASVSELAECVNTNIKTVLQNDAKSVSDKTPSGDKRNRPSVTGQNWMGWNVKQIEKNTIFSQTGLTSGHSSFVCMVPETETAVIVLSNSAYGTRDLGLQILRMVNNNWKREGQYSRN
jgi:CubicO group peptidase (beta-lactamase class C family)